MKSDRVGETTLGRGAVCVKYSGRHKDQVNGFKIKKVVQTTWTEEPERQDFCASNYISKWAYE